LGQARDDGRGDESHGDQQPKKETGMRRIDRHLIADAAAAANKDDRQGDDKPRELEHGADRRSNHRPPNTCRSRRSMRWLKRFTTRALSALRDHFRSLVHVAFLARDANRTLFYRSRSRVAIGGSPGAGRFPGERRGTQSRVSASATIHSPPEFLA
jgi:hypothetical protein